MAKTKQQKQPGNQKENQNANKKVAKKEVSKVQPAKGAGKIKKQKKKKAVIEVKKEDVIVLPKTRISDELVPNRVSQFLLNITRLQSTMQCNTINFSIIYLHL